MHLIKQIWQKTSQKCLHFLFFKRFISKKLHRILKIKLQRKRVGGLNTKYAVKPQKGIKMKGRSSCLQCYGQLNIFNFSRGRERRIKYQVRRKTVKRNQTEREEFIFTVLWPTCHFQLLQRKRGGG